MCGNWGMITETNGSNMQKFMWQGLYLDALRGMDSTGLMTLDTLGDITITKKAMPAADFLNLKAVDDQLGDSFNRVFIGHNRAATRGAVNNNNAHPFQHGHITMVHNGSLHGFAKLPDADKFIVDSEAVAHSIMKIGAEETLKLLDGAFALVWWDDESKLLNFARNSERPLTLAKIKDKNTVIWGSEESMLNYVSNRSGLVIEDSWELPEERIVSFDPKAKDIWEECTIQKVEYLYDWRANGYDRNGFPHYGAANQVTKKKTPERTAKDQEEKDKAEKRFKERDRVSKGAFERLGLEKGSEVRFMLWDFKAYNEAYPDAGIWEGCTMEEPFVTCVVYGARKHEYTIGEEYLGNGMSMTKIDPNVGEDSLLNFKLTVKHDSIKMYTGDLDDEYAESTIILASEVHEEKKKELVIFGDTVDLDETETANIDFLYIIGPRGIVISNNDWRELTKHGCGLCAADLNPDDSKYMEWWGENHDSPVCPKCSEIARGKGALH